MTPPKPIADVHTCHATCPCQPSKLGPLEFKAEDFDGFGPETSRAAAERANRLLAERLGAAPVHEWNELKNPDGWVYYRARLVCIEKLEGK